MEYVSALKSLRDLRDEKTQVGKYDIAFRWYLGFLRMSRAPYSSVGGGVWTRDLLIPQRTQKTLLMVYEPFKLSLWVRRSNQAEPPRQPI